MSDRLITPISRPSSSRHMIRDLWLSAISWSAVSMVSFGLQATTPPVMMSSTGGGAARALRARPDGDVSIGDRPQPLPGVITDGQESDVVVSHLARRILDGFD